MLSMTGYGRSHIERDGREMSVELKGVNHRFLDVNLRMPRGLLFLEDTLRKGIAARMSRGHIDVFVTYRNARADARDVTVDTALAGAYLRALDELRALGLPDDRCVTRVAALPDVLTVSERDEDMDAVAALAADALAGALNALLRMRADEGASLCADAAARIGALEAISARIAARAPEVTREYQTKLTARVAELLALPPDPQRIAQEVALMADRAAIDEELVRLQSHFAQARACLSAGEPVGRKLDFLVQEMNREVNTIGSKASDLTIAALVVEAKAEIEKLREQVQNIE